MKILTTTLLISILLLTACGSTTPAENFTNIEDMLALEGIQECTWDFAGDDDFGVFPTEGEFLIDNGLYSFENQVHDSADLTVFTHYDGTNFFYWNDQVVPGRPQLVTKTSLTVYQNSVNHNIGYRSYFKILPDFDYGIVCEEVASVTFHSQPTNAELIEI
tara:strand:+ start:66 stop:548 length:483 start_codon:yes stop_codon:yes gene_type:complete